MKIYYLRLIKYFLNQYAKWNILTTINPYYIRLIT